MNEESSQWPQFLAAISSGILAVGCGLHFGWPGPAIPKLLLRDLQFEVSEEEVSYMVMIGPLGYLISSPFSGFVVDRIGRKIALLLLAVPQIVAWLLIVHATGIPMLYVARLVAGAAEGGIFTILPMYVCEIVEPRIRGTLGSFFSLGLILGILLINCYGSFTPIRTSAYISIAVPLLFLVIFMWMPESPYFFLMKERIENARRCLQYLRRTQNVEEELTELALDVRRQISEPGTMKEVFTIATNRRAFLILLGLRTFQQFSGYSAFSFYTQVIFEHAGGCLSAAESSIIYSASHVVFICLGMVLVDRFGRRPLLLCSTVGTAVCLFLEGLYFYCQNHDYDMSSFTWLPITGMVLYTVLFDIGLGVIPNLLTGEIFSASIKAKGLGILIIYCALAISASSELFRWLQNSFGMFASFLVFGFCCLAGAFFCYCCVPDTKGQSLEEIQQNLKVTFVTSCSR